MGDESEVQSLLLDATTSLAAGLKQIGFEKKIWSANSTFAVLSVSAVSSATGDTTVVWHDERANFTNEWSNPLWSAFELALPTDLTGPLELVRKYFASLPSHGTMEAQGYHVSATLSQVLHWKWVRFTRTFAFWWSSAVSWVPGHRGTNETSVSDQYGQIVNMTAPPLA